jgi:hypothetical protein
MPKIQVNKAFVFFEGACDFQEFWFRDTTVVGKAQCQAFQTAVSAQPIRENKIVNITRSSLVGPW